MDVKHYLRRTFPGYLYSRYKKWRYETRILPETKHTELEGVKLDVEGLHLEIKRVILDKLYEASEVELCTKVLSSGENILEIGGAIGFVGLFCLKSLQANCVVSVEPNPATLQHLRRNYALNGLTPRVIEAALADTDKTVQLTASPDFWSNTILPSATMDPLNQIAVKAKSLATIVSEIKESLTAVIVDIEGAEIFLDWDQLPASVTKIILELHPGVVGHAKSYGILNELLNRGFEVAGRSANVFGLIKAQPPAPHRPSAAG